MATEQPNNDSAAELRGELLDITREFGYIRREVPFRLSSGAFSHDYVDMRAAVATGDALEIAARAVIATLREEGCDFDVIGGMTMGADPVAHAVALLAHKGWYSVRKAEKDHGRANRIEGSKLEPGVRAIVFEDTTSTGGSILDALAVVQTTGASVVSALTLLDRADMARTAFTERAIPYRSLLTYRDLGIEPLDPRPQKDEPTATT
jgi:orotate phosphoribosyltransferase